MEQILEKLDKRSRQQLIFTKVLCVLCVVVLVCFGVLMFGVAEAVQEVLVQIAPLKEMAAQAEAVFSDLEAVDFAALNQTVQELSGLETVDFAALNQTVQELSDLIDPLVKIADFFG